MLPELNWDFLNTNEIATSCTDPAEMNHEDFPEDSLEEYLERVSRAIRENEPYPPVPLNLPKISLMASAPLPPLPGPSLENPYWVDGGVKIRPTYRDEIRGDAIWGMCTPSRDSITGYDPYRCNCATCRETRREC